MKFQNIVHGVNGITKVTMQQTKYLYTPLTSVEVERLFSKVKRMLKERPNLTIDSLEMLIFVNIFPN